MQIIYNITNVPNISKNARTQERKNKHENNRKQAENSILTMTDLYRLSNRDSHCEIDAKSRELISKTKPLQSSAKLDETMAKISTTYFHSGGEISRK
jgi:hypothetical protein